jgi:rhamnose transport system permease protein
MNTRGLTALASWDSFLATTVVAVFVYAAYCVPGFLTSFNISQAIAGVSEKALIVLPMVFLIIAREIDISVASMLALTSVIFGVLLQAGMPLPAAIAVVLACGAALGALNGLLVALMGLPSLVVTLGTLAMFRGAGYVILGSGSVNQLPEGLTSFGIGNIGSSPIPWTILPFLVLAPVFALVLHKTSIGRRIYAIGGNPEASRYSGVRVRRIRFWLFVTSGLICSIAGIVFTARLANARANNAVGFELDIITIALLGGISVFGGKGRLTGVLWALALLAMIRNALGLSLVGGDAQGTVIGSLLIAVLLFSNSVSRIVEQLRLAKHRAAAKVPH